MPATAPMVIAAIGVTNPAAKLPIDDVFYVELPHRFLRLLDSSSSAIGITDSRIEKGTQTALYAVSRTSTTSKGLPILTLNVGTQGLDDTVFNTFGTTAAKDRIDAVFAVIGRSTGLRTTISVGPHLRGARVVCLDIPDDYEYMDPALVALLQTRVPPLLTA